jgi:hypothetical protein
VILVSIWLRLANNEVYFDEDDEKFRVGRHPSQKYTRATAALVLHTSIKTLNDYLLMIRKGREE